MWILELMEVRDDDTNRNGEKWADLEFILKTEVVNEIRDNP